MDESITGAISTMNPFANAKVGSMSTFASIGLVLAIVFIIFVLICVIIWIYMVKRQYWINIHVFRNIGNNPTRVAMYKAKEVSMGFAGDKLWRVAPSGAIGMAFSIIKWIPAVKFQTAPREFWYWIRKDGEWINFRPSDIDEISKEMGVKFVQEDMRLSRISTERILEQRLLNKSFWEKYGMVIGYVIFFLVITVAIIIIFYQWSKLIEAMTPLVQMMTETYAKAQAGCQASSLVPVVSP